MNHLDKLKISCKNIDEIAHRVSRHEKNMFNQALFPLLKESVREIESLTQKIDHLTSCSLHTRNIFELYLILRHVNEDEKALKNWIGQSHKDSSDINEGFICLCKTNGLDVSELEEVQRFIDKSLEESPFESKGAFQVRNLAEEYGYLDDYMAVYKLCSKLIHPSSMKVNFYEELCENNNYLKIVQQIGVHFSLKLQELAVKIEADYA